MVDSMSPGRHRVLYTWTTADQIAALRAGGRLLRRERSARSGYSRFDRSLRAVPTEQQSAIHRRLLSKGYTCRRFAWPMPWATLMGWGEETYGCQLLRIELKPEAQIAAVEPSAGAKAGRWLLDAGRGLEAAEIDPKKIGAVFHVHKGGRPCLCTSALTPASSWRASPGQGAT